MTSDQSRCDGNFISLWVGSKDSNQHRNDHENAPYYSQPRFRWSELLHQRFVNIVAMLGGVEKAKPKAIIERMHVDGLTTNHVKSHLQKYKRDLRSGKVLPPIPPPTEAPSVRLGISTSANWETSNMTRNNPTPPFNCGTGTSTPTGETSNINSFQSTCSPQVGGDTSSQDREATNTNGTKVASYPDLRPCTSPGGETSHMKKMKVASLHLGLGGGTSAPNVDTSNIRRINTTSPLHLGSRASMLNGKISSITGISAIASPPDHLCSGTSTGNVLPSNIIGNFNEAEAALGAQLEEQRRLHLVLAQMAAQRDNPLLAFQYMTRAQYEHAQSLQAQHNIGNDAQGRYASAGIKESQKNEGPSNANSDVPPERAA